MATEVSLGGLGIYSGAGPGPHYLQWHPSQHHPPHVQSMFKDCPQAMGYGQVRDAPCEKVKLALFLLDENIELHLVAAKGGVKGSDFSPPMTTTTNSFYFDDPMLHHRLHPP